MKNNSVKYSSLPTEEPSVTLTGFTGDFLTKSALTGPANLSKAEEGLSYKSIFTYSSPSSGGTDRFAEYWRPTEFSVINEPRHDESGVVSFFSLFLHPPFATNGSNKSAITSDAENFRRTILTVVRHVSWMFMFILFTFAWVLLFPFHWYWTLSRVRLNEAVIVFRVGQPPIVRKKPGSFLCIWPMLDRMHRVSLSRRGFNVPPTRIGLNDGAVVRLGADISFHVTDPLRFVRMSCDTATSIRHVVHGQFIGYLSNNHSLENLQRFSGGVQTELRQICFRHLQQFGVFVDTLTLSQLEVLKQPTDAGQELIKTVLEAIGKPGTVNSLSSIIGSAMPFAMPHSVPPPVTQDGSESTSGIDKTHATRITEFLSNSLRQITPETQSSLGVTPDTMFRLTLGNNDSWLLFPYTGHVDGPVRPPQNEDSDYYGGYKERASLYVSDWETLEGLRDGKISPLSATMSGLLRVSGDSSALAKLFDPSKM